MFFACGWAFTNGRGNSFIGLTEFFLVGNIMLNIFFILHDLVLIVHVSQRTRLMEAILDCRSLPDLLSAVKSAQAV